MNNEILFINNMLAVKITDILNYTHVFAYNIKDDC